jgi:hypothetical protein
MAKKKKVHGKLSIETYGLEYKYEIKLLKLSIKNDLIGECLKNMEMRLGH